MGDTALAEIENKIKTVVLQHGQLGVDVKMDGEAVWVTAVTGDNARNAGVQVGWHFKYVDGLPFSMDLLKQRIGGKEPYKVTFAVDAEAAKDSDLSLALVPATAQQTNGEETMVWRNGRLQSRDEAER